MLLLQKSSKQLHNQHKQILHKLCITCQYTYMYPLHTLCVCAAELILMQWKNTLANFCSDNSTFCDKLASFIKQNLDYMNTMIEQNEGDPYWYQVKLFLAQLEGLMIGYAFAGLEPLDSNQLL